MSVHILAGCAESMDAIRSLISIPFRDLLVGGDSRLPGGSVLIGVSQLRSLSQSQSVVDAKVEGFPSRVAA
jgi:hypothetical protein